MSKETSYMKTKGIGQIRLLVFLLTIVLFIAIYYVKLSLSNGEFIEAGSVESYILVPNILKDESLVRIGVVKNYYYSAADGAKPVIYVVNILTRATDEIIKAKTEKYFLSKGFKENEKDELWSGQKEITISVEKTNERLSLIHITLFEYI